MEVMQYFHSMTDRINIMDEMLGYVSGGWEVGEGWEMGEGGKWVRSGKWVRVGSE